MKKKNISSLFAKFKDVKMTNEEKKETWNGVLRRSTDFADGQSPFPDTPNTWDGVLRRATDFPDGVIPPISTEETKDENPDRDASDADSLKR